MRVLKGQIHHKNYHTWQIWESAVEGITQS